MGRAVGCWQRGTEAKRQKGTEAKKAQRQKRHRGTEIALCILQFAVKYYHFIFYHFTIFLSRIPHPGSRIPDPISRILLIVLLGIIPFTLQGQYYSTGQDPASYRWMHLKTDSFHIIVPRHLGNLSHELAGVLQLVTRAETKTLQTHVPRMPFIFHPASVVSNGVTVWAPRRIELYPCPPQDIYPEPWIEQLAIHEYRHAVQTAKMNRGFTKGLYYIFGEQATGAVLGLYLPPWFLEGDATVTETALSNSGRGRVASFSAPLRAQLLQKGIYSYDKATLGSYKTFTPDAYTLGYQLVARGRKNYGWELWDHTLDKVARLPFMVVPFNAGIRQKTGKWKSMFYHDIMAECLSEWQAEEDASWETPFYQITRPDPRNYSSFDNPQYLSDSLLIAVRTSNEGVTELVTVDLNGKMKRISRLGNYQQNSLSVAGDIIMWAETESDIRWENRSFSVIKVQGFRLIPDRASRIPHPVSRIAYPVSRIPHRFFSPVLSPSGDRIAVIYITEENASSVEILDTQTGNVSQSIPAGTGGLFLQPSWSNDEQTIGCLHLDASGKSLLTIDLKSNRITEYLPAGFTQLTGPPLFFHQYLLFAAGFTGIENIFAIDTATRQLFQVTSARFQANNPSLSPNGDAFIYCNYTADGMMVVSRSSDPSLWVPLDAVPVPLFPLAEAMAEQEGCNIQEQLRKIPNSKKQIPGKFQIPKTKIQGSSKFQKPNSNGYQKDSSFSILNSQLSIPDSLPPYAKASHLFNVHSWGPLSINASSYTLKPGITVLSQNLLNTAFASAGYEYDLNERTGKVFLDFSYQGWFPVIDFSYSFGKRAGTGKIAATNETFRYTWNESNLGIDIGVPLNFSRGNWFRKIQPSVGSSWIYVLHDKETPEKFTEGSVFTLDYGLFCYNYIRSNYQDIYPRFGQSLRIIYRHTPFGQNNMGAIFGASGNLYLPGLFRHHGIRAYGGYQQRWDELVYGYQFANTIAYPRGITQTYDEYLISFSGNYAFPFGRIDASIGSLFYIKRFTLNLFYDGAKGWNKHGDTYYQSTGFELSTEVNILRFFSPFELGVQGAYLPDDHTWSWQFLWGVKL